MSSSTTSLSSSWATIDTDSTRHVRSASPSPSSRASIDSSVERLEVLSQDYSDSDDDDADEEWRESVRQLELFSSMVLFPLLGKWIGRRTAYWVWAKVMTWRYPSKEVVITSRKVFEGVGLLEAAGSGLKKTLVG